MMHHNRFSGLEYFRQKIQINCVLKKSKLNSKRIINCCFFNLLAIFEQLIMNLSTPSTNLW